VSLDVAGWIAYVGREILRFGIARHTLKRCGRHAENSRKTKKTCLDWLQVLNTKMSEKYPTNLEGRDMKLKKQVRMLNPQPVYYARPSKKDPSVEVYSYQWVGKSAESDSVVHRPMTIAQKEKYGKKAKRKESKVKTKKVRKTCVEQCEEKAAKRAAKKSAKTATTGKKSKKTKTLTEAKVENIIDDVLSDVEHDALGEMSSNEAYSAEVALKEVKKKVKKAAGGAAPAKKKKSPAKKTKAKKSPSKSKAKKK